MKRWLIRCLLLCYPRPWRRRYGEEFAALLEELPLTPGGWADALRHLADAHRRQWTRNEAAVGRDDARNWWVATLLRGSWYGALAGSVAGAVSQIARLLGWALLAPYQPSTAFSTGTVLNPLITPPTLVFFGLIGALGGAFFGVIIGALASLGLAATGRPGGTGFARAAVCAVASLAWLWNTAISPRATARDWLGLLELGIIGLCAAWWLGGRVVPRDRTGRRVAG